LSAATEWRGEEALAAGAVGAMAKPFDPVKLVAEIKDALAGRSAGLILADQPEPDIDESKSG
jgi:hypothetical protein